MAADNSKKTAPGRPFEPGQSGNPGGRPKVAKEFKEKCRDFMSDEGWEKLKSIAINGKKKDQFRALELIAAYAYGKPKQGVELSGEDGGNINITIEKV